MTKQKASIFLGGPFSSAMGLSSDGPTFDIDLKRWIEHVLESITSLRCLALSAHIADKFGAQFDESSFVIRDNSWAKACDVYIALLPLNADGEPYRTDGTCVEIGLALAYEKRVILVMQEPANAAWSYYMRNLAGSAKNIRLVEWSDFMSNTDTILEHELVFLQTLSVDNPINQRIQTTDAVAMLHELSQKTSVDTVVFRELELKVFPEVLSPRISHAPDYLVENWHIPRGSRVLDLGCGSGVLGLYALYSGASELFAVDKNPRACENVRLNAKSLGFGNRTTVLEGDAYGPLPVEKKFEVIILSPPYWNRRASTLLEASCFDEDHNFLRASVMGADKHLVPGGSVFIVFSDQGDLSMLGSFIEESGLKLRRLLVQRPTMIGGHIRFFYELTKV